MAVFDFSKEEFRFSRENKSMYLFFMNKCIDISVPHSLPDLIDFYRMYQRETGNATPRIIGVRRQDGGLNFTVSESDYFRPRFDVQINYHSNYIPVLPHAHEYFELLINAKGSSRVFFGDEEVSLNQGDLLMVPPYVEHANMVFTDECAMFSMAIRLSTIRSRFPALFMGEHLLSGFFGRSYGASDKPHCLIFRAGDYFLGDNLLADIYNEYTNPQEYTREYLDLLVSEFFLVLLRHYSQDAAELVFNNSRSQVETLITQYIREHPDTVSMSELSQQFSYSERQISRLIRHSTGMSYSQLVRKIRMEAIGELVGNTVLPIEHIIANSGVSSPSYFYKLFRSYFGMTPGEYRERAQSASAGAVQQAASGADSL